MTDTAQLPASRDNVTGQIYVPPRRFAADGSLRECERIEVPAVGTLASWTCHKDVFYGLLDLPSDVRIQALLADGPHEVGRRYHGIDFPDGKVRFVRD